MRGILNPMWFYLDLFDEIQSISVKTYGNTYLH
ncbi:hypothetical protein NIES932_01600 [Raphidiopsis curvata NIES-932]|nr:hypothetical protein NIES932_01600 [Raphidiopsis curvata NIES-932]